MTIAPLSMLPAAVTGSTAATPAPPASSSAGFAQAAPSPKSTTDTSPPPAPLKMATYPKSVIPQPFPPAFPEAHLPPPDPSAADDTVTISDAARKAVASAAADGAPAEAVA